MAQRIDPRVTTLDMPTNGLTFTKELHAIEALIAGQGVGLFSDVLVAHELATGELVKLLDLALPGFGFYLTRTRSSTASHHRRVAEWLRSVQ
jgi:LysR family glycine cleavage system transcriptional activator